MVEQPSESPSLGEGDRFTPAKIEHEVLTGAEPGPAFTAADGSGKDYQPTVSRPARAGAKRSRMLLVLAAISLGAAALLAARRWAAQPGRRR